MRPVQIGTSADFYSEIGHDSEFPRGDYFQKFNPLLFAVLSIPHTKIKPKPIKESFGPNINAILEHRTLDSPSIDSWFDVICDFNFFLKLSA